MVWSSFFIMTRKMFIFDKNTKLGQNKMCKKAKIEIKTQINR